MSRQLLRLETTLGFLLLLLAITTLSPGCGESQATSTVSPVVSPDSPEAQKALAETQAMLREREAAEAKAHRRRPKLPNPERGS